MSFLLRSAVQGGTPAPIVPAGPQAWSYIGIPYPTDNVPGAIMPTLPTGADTAAFPYDPCTITKPATTDVADWDNAPNYWYIKFDGNDGTAGNNQGGTLQGNPTNPRRTLPAGPFNAGTVLFVEGQGNALPTSDTDPNRNYADFTDWRDSQTFPTFNSAGTYSSTADISWIVGIGLPRIATQQSTNHDDSRHLIWDGIVLDEVSGGNTRGGLVINSNCHYFTFRNGAQYGQGANVGGQAFGLVDCEYHVYYNNECAYFGAWDVQGDPDFHGWRPSWGNKWLWCIDCNIHSLKGDSTQVGNSNNTNTEAGTSHYIYMAGNEYSNNQENAIDCKNCFHVICSENYIHDFDGAGAGTGANTTGIILSQDGEGPHSAFQWAIANELDNCGAGIRAAGDNEDGEQAGSGEPSISQRDYMIANVIRDCNGPALSYNHGGTRLTEGSQHYGINNTVVRCADGASVNLFQPSNPSDVYLHGNLFVECGTDAIVVAGTAGLDRLEVTDNLLHDDAVTPTVPAEADVDTGNLEGNDPLFTNEVGNDFTLQSGSPARNATTEHAVYATFQSMYGIDLRADLAGTTRPKGAGWDMGAYEFDE